jgi:hypothetical protein
MKHETEHTAPPEAGQQAAVTMPIDEYRPSRCNYLYVCRVAVDGSFVLGPSGWTVQKTAPGTYVITHNLGHQRYAVLPVAFGTYKSTITLLNFADNSVTLGTQDNQSAADVAFTAVFMATR